MSISTIATLAIGVATAEAPELESLYHYSNGVYNADRRGMEMTEIHTTDPATDIPFYDMRDLEFERDLLVTMDVIRAQIEGCRGVQLSPFDGYAHIKVDPYICYKVWLSQEADVCSEVGVDTRECREMAEDFTGECEYQDHAPEIFFAEEFFTVMRGKRRALQACLADFDVPDGCNVGSNGVYIYEAEDLALAPNDSAPGPKTYPLLRIACGGDKTGFQMPKN